MPNFIGEPNHIRATPVFRGRRVGHGPRAAPPAPKPETPAGAGPGPRSIATLPSCRPTIARATGHELHAHELHGSPAIARPTSPRAAGVAIARPTSCTSCRRGHEPTSTAAAVHGRQAT